MGGAPQRRIAVYRIPSGTSRFKPRIRPVSPTLPAFLAGPLSDCPNQEDANVRSVVVSSRPVLTKIAAPASASGNDLNAIVEKAARAHEVDPLLVHSIIKVESNYNTHAVSNKGAQGLMQLTPSTARMLGVSNSFDPEQKIEAGVKYLKYLKDLYKDDRLALAAYNAGPGAVDKYKWIPPYAETENYVYQVGKRYGEARRAADAAKPVEVKAPEVKAVEVTPTEVKPAPVQTFIDENGRLHLRTTQ